MKAFFSSPAGLAAAAVGLASLAASSSCSAQAGATTQAGAMNTANTMNNSRPNVLLILADDLGWSDLGCFGGEIRTPNIDGLARNGLSFTQCYNSARCSPTRASLLTGLNPHQAGVANIGPPLSKRAVTLPEVLGEAGYSTSMVGKWHLTEASTPIDRGFNEFYGMLGGFNSYFQEEPYFSRLPAGRARISYKPGEFYSTNAFGDYSIRFIDQSRQNGKPWFQYLAFNAPHFPLMAPAQDIARYEKVYEAGWDKIRADRLARQKKLGLAPQNLSLTPRSDVPRNFINAQTGWADKDNPAWDSLPANRRADLARRMAAYAATVDVMDQAVGRVVAHLKATNQLDNTLIFFLSDNGACAEWDPFGFDKLDSPLNILHQGGELQKIGGPDSYISYGSGWANASNTPWRLYKHYAHEGGIRTPLIVHWPRGLKLKAGARSDEPIQVEDFMPTLLQLAGALYPTERNGASILPLRGASLVPIFNGGSLATRALFMEHEGNRMVREGSWKLEAIHDRPWELYNLANDPTEMNDLSAREPARVQQMSADWETWAESSMVKPRAKLSALPSPQLVGKSLVIRCDVEPEAQAGAQVLDQVLDGVILAQGGDQRGYALYLTGGKPVFAVRQNGTLYTAASSDAPVGRFSLEARLARDGAMTLSVNGAIVARGKAPGVFTAQPKDELSIGEDTLSPVGDYQGPHPLRGKVKNVQVTAE